MGEQKRVRGKSIPKHETEANWSQSNYVPEWGEIVTYDIDENHPVPREKIGDGKRKVKDLPFVGANLEEAKDIFATRITEKDWEDDHKRTYYLKNGVKYISTSPVRLKGEIPIMVRALSSDKSSFWSYINSEGKYIDIPKELQNIENKLATPSVYIETEIEKELIHFQVSVNPGSNADTNVYVTVVASLPVPKQVGVNVNVEIFGLIDGATASKTEYIVFEKDQQEVEAVIYVGDLWVGELAEISNVWVTPENLELTIEERNFTTWRSVEGAISYEYITGEPVPYSKSSGKDASFSDSYNRVYVEMSKDRGQYSRYTLTSTDEPPLDPDPLDYSHGNTLDSIPMRLSNGHIIVPEVPTAKKHAASKSYVDASAKKIKDENNTLTGYTRSDKVLAINKTNQSWMASTMPITFVDPEYNVNCYVAEFDLTAEVKQWGGAGLQFYFLNTPTAWLMINPSKPTDGNAIESSSSGNNRSYFELTEQDFINNSIHVRLEASRYDRFIICYINGKNVCRKDFDKDLGQATQFQLGCAVEFLGKVWISNCRALGFYDRIPEDVSVFDTINWDGVPKSEELVENQWSVTQSPYNLDFVNKNYLKEYAVHLPKQDEYYDTIISLNSKNSPKKNYYLTETDQPPTSKGSEYYVGCGYYKERFPDQTIDWNTTYYTPDKLIYDPTEGTGVQITVSNLLSYNDKKALVLSKAYAGAQTSQDSIVFYPTGKTTGKKFVFETEISWGGVTKLNSSGQWCARIRFINASKQPMTTDTGCFLGFSGANLSINSDKASYVEQNKLTSVDQWALLRLEMIKKTLYVYINDKQIYSYVNTSNKEVSDETLGGFRIEFRGAAESTSFMFNNTYVGAVDETIPGRQIVSIPARLSTGHIRVPSTPVHDNDAISKSYFETAIIPILEDYLKPEILHNVCIHWVYEPTSGSDHYNYFKVYFQIKGNPGDTQYSSIADIPPGEYQALEESYVGSDYWNAMWVGKITSITIEDEAVSVYFDKIPNSDNVSEESDVYYGSPINPGEGYHEFEITDDFVIKGYITYAEFLSK